MLLELLDAFRSAGPGTALSDHLPSGRRALLRSGELPALVDHATRDPDSENGAAARALLTALLDEARMDAENGGAAGAPFFAALEAAVDDRLADLSSDGTLALTVCYGRAQVPVPPRLSARHVAQLEAAAPPAGAAAPEIDGVLKSLLRQAKGDAYAVAEGLRESTAGLPPEFLAALAHEIAGRDAPYAGQLAAYWLLDQSEPVRQATALALLHRARAGACDPTLVRRLPTLRSWMPAGPARAVVDDLVREVRRRGLPPAPPPPDPDRSASVGITLVDGAGCQSMLAELGPKAAVSVLLKEGQGVKDAFLLRFRSRKQANEMLGGFDALAPSEATLEAAATALAAALADGLAHGLPPAPGLVDVADALGLDDLRPQQLGPRDWVARLDPAGRIAGRAPRTRQRLIRDSRDWEVDYAMVDSWFEDSPALRDLLESSDPRRHEALLWDHLEERRELWASRFLRSAHVALAAEEEFGDSLLATGIALLDGEPLRKIPIMETILVNTLNAFEAAQAEAAGDAAGTVSDDELAEFLTAAGFGADALRWLDGYLAAVVLAPRQPDPQAWLAKGLLGRLAAPVGQRHIEALLNAIQLRMNAILEAFEAGDPAPARFADTAPAAWARGFTDGVAASGSAWRSRTLAKTDRSVLDRIRAAGNGEPLDAGTRKLILTWLEKRHHAGDG